MAYTHWLVKAEPETRLERGVDVKFSIDDLERNRTTTWEGVRNHQAKKFLRDEMKLGHGCLFYASNCKEPGVRGIARVCKEGYPDYNAWDPKHPYYDPKSKQENPTWYMVDVEFVSKLAHPVPLALLQLLGSLNTSATAPTASSSSSAPANSSNSSLLLLPRSLSSYLTPSHLEAIHSSALLSRGRLSVQPVSDEFWDAVNLLGEKGGWDEWDLWKERSRSGGGGKKKTQGKAATVDEGDSKTEKGKDKDTKDDEGGANASTKRKRVAAAEASNSARAEGPSAAADDEEDGNEVDGKNRSESKRKKTVATTTKEKEPDSSTSRRNTKRAKRETTDPVDDDEEVKPEGTGMVVHEGASTVEGAGRGGGGRRRNPTRRSKA